MKNIFKHILLILLIFVFSFHRAYSFDLNSVKNKFKKKPKPEKVRMVETEEEYEIEAQEIPVEKRKLNDYTPKASTKHFYYPNAKYRFEKYNYTQGFKESDLSEIKTKQSVYSLLVADINCRYVAYSRYFYSIDNNQISSNFYVEKLDTSKTKVKRMVDFNPLTKKDNPIIESGTKEVYPYLFHSLTLVDWNRSSDKLLIKEKIGSIINGVYKTNLYVHFLLDKKTIKLTDFDEAIRNFYKMTEKIDIKHYRYEIVPLGFSADNDSFIIAHVFMYDKDSNKIFMGTWGYNANSNQTIMLSKDNPIEDISINGLILKQVAD